MNTQEEKNNRPGDYRIFDAALGKFLTSLTSPLWGMQNGGAIPPFCASGASSRQ
jgi:hypothetical protein